MRASGDTATIVAYCLPTGGADCREEGVGAVLTGNFRIAYSLPRVLAGAPGTLYALAARAAARAERAAESGTECYCGCVACARARSSTRRILPEIVFGRSVVNSIWRGYL